MIVEFASGGVGDVLTPAYVKPCKKPHIIRVEFWHNKTYTRFEQRWYRGARGNNQLLMVRHGDVTYYGPLPHYDELRQVRRQRYWR